MELEEIEEKLIEKLKEKSWEDGFNTACDEIISFIKQFDGGALTIDAILKEARELRNAK